GRPGHDQRTQPSLQAGVLRGAAPGRSWSRAQHQELRWSRGGPELGRGLYPGAMILRDSIDAPLIPRDTPVVAGYGDGVYIWSPSWRDGTNWWDLFPNAIKLVIVVSAAHSGDVLDVESGDATPAEVPGWCDRFQRSGRRRPTIYCSRDAIAAVRQAAGGRVFDWWAATLDGT